MKRDGDERYVAKQRICNGGNEDINMKNERNGCSMRGEFHDRKQTPE